MSPAAIQKKTPGISLKIKMDNDAPTKGAVEKYAPVRAVPK